MCYQLVRCTTCDVIYANETPNHETIGRAYHEAAYNSKTEAQDAAGSYLEALKPHFQTLKDRTGVLEIGTGTGVFLQQLKTCGFSDLVGVEPSRAAIEAAEPEIKPVIKEGLFEKKDFSPKSFSFLCCFMTLEHVSEPKQLMAESHSLLKPGGMMAVVVHDWRAWNNRILGAKAPIIDIEHLQLFSAQSIEELFKRTGFTDVRCASFKNRYSLAYWNRLFPTPAPLKRLIHRLLEALRIDNLHLPMNVGNLMVIGRAPAAEDLT